MIDRARGVLGVGHREPELTAPAPPELTERGAPSESPGRFWPAGKPLPTVWIRRQRLPCPACRLTELASGSQAVACCSSGPAFAHFRCRACGHRWKLAVREPQP
jgi:hypothetical protein